MYAIYVVLSRVGKMSGLYLCKPLYLDKPLMVPDKLISFERRIKLKEKDFLDNTRESMEKSFLDV